MDVRRLRYRLKRQGMLELDAWLASLDDALLSDNVEVIASVSILLSCEAPVLLAMMHGDSEVPENLKNYLRKSR